MELKQLAMAGTLESSDVMVTVEPADTGITLSISSPVIHQYGAQIRSTVLDALQRLGVENARITVVDKGALDCTLKARVEAAVYRGADACGENVPWGGAVR